MMRPNENYLSEPDSVLFENIISDKSRIAKALSTKDALDTVHQIKLDLYQNCIEFLREIGYQDSAFKVANLEISIPSRSWL